jgi:N-methylhydantoinase A
MALDWIVGIDIGGTFTDVVAVKRDASTTRTAKVPSRPDDPMGALLAALAAVDVDVTEIENLVHGTTRITNAIVEEKLPPVALLTTQGFEDVLPIARLKRRDLYRLDVPPKLPPLVSAEHTVGVAERVRHDGSVERALSLDSINRAVAAARECGPRSVAVCLLHSYANPAHEIELGKALAKHFPHLSLSHEINPEAREFERSTSTVLNAAAMPVVVDYLDELLEHLPLDGRFQLFHSAGGWATPEAVRERPLIMAMSGPAAGVAASARMSSVVERRDLLTFDMGGTTTDVCLVVDGEAQVTDQREIAERPLRQPMIAIDSIGAGGGSIVRLGSGGLSIGPDSAGAEPGPACYGRGGVAPTVTDANAVLGYLNPERRLGGAISLDVAAAHTAIEPIAHSLDRDVVETSLGIVRVANATMARALRRVTVERGIDGRRCTLLAFGGAGPMHAVGLAEEFGISDVVVPAVSSAFSAYGCLLADMSYTRQRTIRMAQMSFDAESFAAAHAKMVDELVKPFAAQGVDASALATETVALMRYDGQSSTVPVILNLPLDVVAVGQEFTAQHQDLYGYATDEPWIIEGLRVRVSAPTKADITKAESRHSASPKRSSECWFQPDRPTPTPCYDRDELAADQHIPGPAMIEDQWSTIIVPPRWSVRADHHANLILTKESS